MHGNSEESKINGHRFNDFRKFPNALISKDGKAYFSQLSLGYFDSFKRSQVSEITLPLHSLSIKNPPPWNQYKIN